MEVNTQFAGGNYFTNGYKPGVSDGDTSVPISGLDAFKKIKERIIEEHKLTPDNIKREKDWRKMSDAQWDKLMEQVDEYIDDFREELKRMKELQEEAARKAAACAPADMKAQAAASAALKAASNGITSEGFTVDEDHLEKISWTYEMETDDQVILAKAKMANEFAHDVLSKSQELALVGDTTEGISQTEEGIECALAEESEEGKVWTITAFTEQGIICSEWKNGITRELWRIEYKDSGDCKKVWDFLTNLKKADDTDFIKDKDFWMEFLAG